ncbi:fungal-specific transcription factor domain-containing protein [Xylariaceae sp. FL1651]|nr:fungal-specific transcription factor domain-containing protein [Xylariaceae sp. FL1651]
MGRQRDRTFTGCWKCRQRKVKCDEKRPHCSPCRRLGVSCTGYDAKYVWVKDQGQIPKSVGRRILDCEKTWSGFETLSSDMADFLISECDMETSSLATSVGVEHTSLKSMPHNPFSVFSADLRASNTGPIVTLTLHETAPTPRGMVTAPDLTLEERMLFHHYVTHVSEIMMPYEHPRNPWRLHYPAVALSRATADQQALYNAILAQAAFNLAHLSSNIDAHMVATGSRYYRLGIEKLLEIRGDHTNDFGATIASIMTILFSEIYSGQLSAWRRHLQGAWSLFKAYRHLEPWKVTESVCLSLQSLNIVRIISDTSERASDTELSGHDVDYSTDSMLLGLVSTTSGFGFTIGAPQVVLDCISIISSFRDGGRSDIDYALEHVLTLLNQCTLDAVQSAIVAPTGMDAGLEMPKGIIEARCQSNAFIFATYIYLYRTLLDVTPKVVHVYVSKTLREVSTFFENGTGNFSIWPAFIAAIEAYTHDDLSRARQWLDSTTKFGIGSRVTVRRVVEEVWRRRETLSNSSRLDPGMIAIDWRQVMHDLDCDILLV